MDPDQDYLRQKFASKMSFNASLTPIEELSGLYEKPSGFAAWSSSMKFQTKLTFLEQFWRSWIRIH